MYIYIWERESEREREREKEKEKERERAHINSSAPDVLGRGRDSLGADVIEWTNRSMVQLQLVGGLFQDRSTTQKKGSHCGSNLRGFISAQHRPSNQHGSTWGQLWPTKPQLNLDPLGSNLVPIWSKMAQLHPKLHPFGSNCQHGGIAGPARNYQRTRFRWYCPLFLASTKLRV